MSRILITGGGGYIGSHTSVCAISNNHRVVVLDDLRNSDRLIINQLFKYDTNHYLDFIFNNTSNLKNVDIVPDSVDSVIHFAADKSVGESSRDPLKYYDNNINSLIDLLRWIVQNGIKNLIFSSSCTVYGNIRKNPVFENDSCGQALSAYGYTKVICERILHDFHKQYPMNICILRYFNPIGANNSANIGELLVDNPENLMPLVCEHAYDNNKRFYLYGNDYNTSDGSCIRDFIDVNDLARSHLESLNWLKNQDNILEIFNVGTGNGVSVKTILREFVRVNELDASLFTAKDKTYSESARRYGDMEAVWANTDKMKRVVGFETKVPLEDSLRSSWNWFKYLKENLS